MKVVVLYGEKLDGILYTGNIELNLFCDKKKFCLMDEVQR